VKRVWSFLWNYTQTDHATIVAGKPAPSFFLLGYVGYMGYQGLLTRTYVYEGVLVLAPRDILKNYITTLHAVVCRCREKDRSLPSIGLRFWSSATTNNIYLKRHKCK
jgi:hypothetical protein